jgi:hypothetical protein
MPVREPMLMDRWPDENLLWVELRDLEPDPVARPEPFVATRQVALLVSLVLATLSLVTVTTGWWKGSTRDRATSWPQQMAPPKFKRSSIGPASRSGAR